MWTEGIHRGRGLPFGPLDVCGGICLTGADECDRNGGSPRVYFLMGRIDTVKELLELRLIFGRYDHYSSLPKSSQSPRASQGSLRVTPFRETGTSAWVSA